MQYRDTRTTSTLFLDVIICLMTTRSASSNTFVTEERSNRAAFITPALSVKIVIWPSDSGQFKLLTSVSAAIVSPNKKGKGGK